MIFFHLGLNSELHKRTSSNSHGKMSLSTSMSHRRCWWNNRRWRWKNSLPSLQEQQLVVLHPKVLCLPRTTLRNIFSICWSLCDFYTCHMPIAGNLLPKKQGWLHVCYSNVRRIHTKKLHYKNMWLKMQGFLTTMMFLKETVWGVGSTFVTR